MARVDQATTPTRAAASPAPAREREFLPLALAGFIVLLFYAGAYGVRHLRIPVADDTFFYVGAIRAVSRIGLSNGHLAARPAYPLMAAALQSIAGGSPWSTAVALPIAMAAGFAVAGGALARRWGLGPWGSGLFAILVGLSVTTSRLMAGKSENLLNVWLLAGLLVVAVSGRRRPATVAIGALAFGAGLAESPFLAAFLGLLALTLLQSAIGPKRARAGSDIESAGPGDPKPLALWAMWWASLAGALAVGLVVFVWNRTSPGDAIQRLLPAFQYGPRLRQELALAWPPLTAALVVGGWWAARRSATHAVRPTLRLLEVWALVTALALAIGLVGARLPTYRALTFALPVALGVAAAAFLPMMFGNVLAGASADDRARRLVPFVAAAALALAAAYPATLTWYHDFHSRISSSELGEIVSAGNYADRLSGDRSVILVVDRPNILLSYFYERAAYATLSPAQSGRVLVFLGTSADLLAGRPSSFGDSSRNAFSRKLFESLRPALEAGDPILAGRTLDPAGYARATASGRPMTGSLAVLRGPAPTAIVSTRNPLPVPHWWALLARALAMLMVISASGLGWSWLALSNASAAVRSAVAPAFGATALPLIALVAGRMGFAVSGAAGLAVVGLSLAASACALVLAVRRPPPGEPTP